jgi:hypothetical protein
MYPLDLLFELRTGLARDVPQSTRDVYAIPRLSQRRFRDVQEVKLIAMLAARQSFNNIRRDGVRGTSHL